MARPNTISVPGDARAKAAKDYLVNAHSGAGTLRNKRPFQLGQNTIICHMARPVGVAVSIASVSEWNFTPRARRSSSIVNKSHLQKSQVPQNINGDLGC